MRRVLVFVAFLTVAPVWAAPPATATDQIDYMAWDARQPRFSARIADDGKGFIIAPYGDFKQGHKQNLINYIAQNGTQWSAEIKDGRFMNSAIGSYVSFESSEIMYRGWDGAAYSIQLDLKNHRFLKTQVKAAAGPARGAGPTGARQPVTGK